MNYKYDVTFTTDRGNCTRQVNARYIICNSGMVTFMQFARIGKGMIKHQVSEQVFMVPLDRLISIDCYADYSDTDEKEVELLREGHKASTDLAKKHGGLTIG